MEASEALNLLRGELLKSSKSIRTLGELGALSGNTVDKVRTGKSRDLMLSTFLALCDAADCPPVKIFAREHGDGPNAEELTLLASFRGIADERVRAWVLETLRFFAGQQ